jgi:hypothetical protein
MSQICIVLAQLKEDSKTQTCGNTLLKTAEDPIHTCSARTQAREETFKAVTVIVKGL